MVAPQRLLQAGRRAMTLQPHLSEPGTPTGQNLVSPRSETSRSLQGLLGLLVVVFYPCKKGRQTGEDILNGYPIRYQDILAEKDILNLFRISRQDIFDG
jgi:hypothetical protein